MHPVFQNEGERIPPLFLPDSPLKLENCPTTPHLPPLAHVPPHPLKKSDFSANPYHKLKVTKFLVKLSQFKLLVYTDKNIFVYKLFCL